MYGLVNVIPILDTVCVYSTHLDYTVMYMCTVLCTTVNTTYAFCYALARDSQDGLRIECLYGEFLAKCLPSEPQDLMCAGESVQFREVSGSWRSRLWRFLSAVQSRLAVVHGVHSCHKSVTIHMVSNITN